MSHFGLTLLFIIALSYTFTFYDISNVNKKKVICVFRYEKNSFLAIIENYDIRLAMTVGLRSSIE